MINKEEKVVILGAGSWGTALAIHLARNHIPVCLWEFDKYQVELMQRDHCNKRYASGVPFPDIIQVTDSLETALNFANDILLVVPSFAFRQTILSMGPYVTEKHSLIWATKGIDESENILFDQLVTKLLGERPLGALSGPSFASEVLQELPTAVAFAANNIELSRRWEKRFNSNTFKVFSCDDLIGVQLGGAVKNVMAIATGMSDGLGYGANARYALITQGLQEIIRLGKAMGAKPETFFGLSGLGDLALTCSETQSRNHGFGLFVAQGGSLDSFEKKIGQVVEGYNVVAQVKQLANQYHVSMPICEKVYDVLYGSAKPQEVVNVIFS